MDNERLIKLLKIEDECILRNTAKSCNRNCGTCDLVQDARELHNMYSTLIKKIQLENVTIKPKYKLTATICGNCNTMLYKEYKFCPTCGIKINWDSPLFD